MAMAAGDDYLHGYATKEQQRLVAQAEHWRDDLILAGTSLAPGSRLLEVGCGVGAVLAVLGEAYNGVELSGVDIEPAQIEFARGYLASLDIEADLRVADAMQLPFPDASFEHVWMMWFLEHLASPVDALREARRVLVPGGMITVIEADYSTAQARPSTPALEAIFAALVQGLATTGHSDAGPQAAHWMAEAGLTVVDPGELHCSYDGAAAHRQANYVADAVEDLIGTLATLPRTASEAELNQGLRELRQFDGQLAWVLYKTRGVRSR